MLRRIAPLLVLAGLPSIALAQGDPPNSTPRDTVPMSLPTIEVTGAAGSSYLTHQTTTATKTETPLRDVPQAVTVITKNVIADQRMQSMADVTRYTPGITMGQGEGNRDQPTIRGNNTTAGFFVNGMRDDVQYFRDLYNVERVEALKGANALIFGRGVGGGVLNRVTKTADWTSTRELSLQGGSYGNKRAALDVGQGVSDNIALRLNTVYENSDLYRNDVNVERYGINPTATIQVTPRTRVACKLRALQGLQNCRPGDSIFCRRTSIGCDPTDVFWRSLAELCRCAGAHGHRQHRAHHRRPGHGSQPEHVRRL